YDRWSTERAREWYDRQPWLVGCNFIPSTAINQLEMWQAETFDLPTIRRELGWAKSLGFNSLRVFLHDLVWSADRAGFVRRINQFLSVSKEYGMSTIFVLFDDCHRPDPQPGPQPMPVRGIHNSGWQQSPGEKLVLQFCDGTVTHSERTRLRDYVQGILKEFGGDDRILMWDLYNEPGAQRKGDSSNPLLCATWEWAREVPVSQPLTACVDGSTGEKNLATNATQSDVITFHCYEGHKLEPALRNHLERHKGRPVICTEYMARELGTTFQHSLPIFRRHRIGCYNWGLVAGKTQTHFNWETVQHLEALKSQGQVIKPGDPIPEPELWFHDIFRPDGSAFDPSEVEFIRQITRTTQTS
ncbi:MAG: glycoside hydrolase family 2, partial [Kiritimatiellae bacterium]|nr:glycoside hydrolase family 2 [Kiritimatiellia bacterium]